MSVTLSRQPPIAQAASGEFGAEPIIQQSTVRVASTPRHGPPNPLLTDSFSIYPDPTVVTQQQLLCRQPQRFADAYYNQRGPQE